MTTAFISEELDIEAEKMLLKYVENVIKIKKCGLLYHSISSHPDIQMFFFEKLREVIVHPDMDPLTLEEINKAGISYYTGSKNLEEKYPGNISYNIAVCGRYYFHHLKYSDPVVMDKLNSAGMEGIHINQGYAKCSILTLGDDALITSDDQVASRASHTGLSVLKLPPGDILLPGQSYGFVGGCTGVHEGEKTIFLNGSLDRYAGGEALRKFVVERGYQVIEFHKGKLTDVGSIFFV
ncbi:MAG: hypothetical protein HGA49_07300 [Eubacteriaceae bacterium]|nr:hypothetical protein [Eubacteriaceae bacterium]